MIIELLFEEKRRPDGRGRSWRDACGNRAKRDSWEPSWWRPPLRRYALSDDQFARIEHLPPGRPGHVGRNSDKGNRLFVEAVIWKFRTGAP